MYESDLTRLLAELKQKDPQLEEAQRAGRARLWDRPQDADLARRFLDARVAPQPYVYYPKDFT